MERILEPEAMDSPAEVAAYDQLVRNYHWLINQPVIRTVARSTKRWGRILDIGTGSARIPLTLAAYCPKAKIYAVELSSNALQLASKNRQQSRGGDRVNLIQADAEQLPFRSNYFDLVLCTSLLHHLPDPVRVLDEISRVAKADGMVFIRDLRRPPRIFIRFFVSFFGFFYNRLMKELYYRSLCAAYSYREFRKTLSRSRLCEARMYPFFITHFTIVRKS